MVKGLYTSYTGMINEQHRLDTVANSIANFDTIGFKKEGATSQAFDDVLAYKIKDVTEAGNLYEHIWQCFIIPEFSPVLYHCFKLIFIR